MKKSVAKEREEHPRMFLIPCSCGTSFAIAEDFDRQGTHIRSFIPCPNCGKRHDPKNTRNAGRDNHQGRTGQLSF